MAGKDDTGRTELQSGNVLLYVTVGLYLLGLVAVAKVARDRKRRAAEFSDKVQAHFGGSYGPGLLVLTTFSTVFSGMTVTGVPQEAFDEGFVSLRWVGATAMIVCGMLALFPRLRRLAVTRGYISPIDFIADRYITRRLRLLCAICSCIPMLIYVTTQLISFAAMVEGMTLNVVPKWASMLGFVAIVLALEIIGGMNSVILTDAVQAAIMILSFLVVPVVLAIHYGNLWEMAPADCQSLVYVESNVSDPSIPPAECSAHDPGCIAAGCIDAVRPEFYLLPTRSKTCSIIWFLLNMFAAPLQPHMIQRVYIASSESDLRIVMGAMLVAPFLAQIPGILMGLTKAAYAPSWPQAAQEATAFSAVTSQLMEYGWFEYFLVTIMTCSSLAAIMSTADSALMGASSIVSVDIYKGMVDPSASSAKVVRVAGLNSILFCAAAYGLGMFLTVSQIGEIVVFQNGMLMQMLPAFGLGIHCGVQEHAITFGIIAGLVSLVFLVAAGDPLSEYIPGVNVSVFINFLVVAALAKLQRPEECSTREQQCQDVRFEERITADGIRALMRSSTEPSKILLALMLGLAIVFAPWYGEPGEQQTIIFGLPQWGCIQFMGFILNFAIGMVAAYQWRPQKSDEEAVSGVQTAQSSPVKFMTAPGVRTMSTTLPSAIGVSL